MRERPDIRNMHKIILTVFISLVLMISVSCEQGTEAGSCTVRLSVTSETKSLDATRNDYIAYYTYDADYLSSSENVYGEVTGESFYPIDGSATLSYFSTGLYRFTVYAWSINGHLLYRGENTQYIRHGENAITIVLLSPQEQLGTVNISIDAIRTGNDRFSCVFERYDGSEFLDFNSFTVTGEGNNVNYGASVSLREGSWKATFNLIQDVIIAKETIDIHVIRDEETRITGEMYPFSDEEGTIEVENPSRLTGHLVMNADRSLVTYVSDTGTPGSYTWYINGIKESSQVINMTDANGTVLYGKVKAARNQLVPSFPHSGTYTYTCRVSASDGESGYATLTVYVPDSEL